MNSSVSSAAASRGPLGADSTGLLPTVSSARTWPSPGVSMAPGRHALSYAGGPHRIGGEGGGLGKHRAPGHVQMARERVEHVHQPTAERAEPLRMVPGDSREALPLRTQEKTLSKTDTSC